MALLHPLVSLLRVVDILLLVLFLSMVWLSLYILSALVDNVYVSIELLQLIVNKCVVMFMQVKFVAYNKSSNFNELAYKCRSQMIVF